MGHWAVPKHAFAGCRKGPQAEVFRPFEFVGEHVVAVLVWRHFRRFVREQRPGSLCIFLLVPPASEV